MAVQAAVVSWHQNLIWKNLIAAKKSLKILSSMWGEGTFYVHSHHDVSISIIFYLKAAKIHYLILRSREGKYKHSTPSHSQYQSVKNVVKSLRAFHPSKKLNWSSVQKYVRLNSNHAYYQDGVRLAIKMCNWNNLPFLKNVKPSALLSGFWPSRR